MSNRSVSTKGLTQEQRSEIIRRASNGEAQKVLASDFSVNQSTVSRILKGGQ